MGKPRHPYSPEYRAQLVELVRSGRNFAGMKRQGALTVPRSVSISALPTIGNGGRPAVPEALTFHPTAYRYSALIERAKQLVSIAQQVESVYLAALEKFDAKSYNLLRARQDLQLSRAGVRLQELRLDSANDGVRLAELQRTRAEIESNHYQGLLDEGLLGLEKSALGFMAAAAALTAAGGFLNFASAIVTGRFGDPAKDAAQSASLLAGATSTTGSIFQTMASYERRKEEWRHQLKLAQHGLATADAQIAIAQDQVLVTGQEHLIAEMQAGSAEDTVEFLVNKFTSAELYEWMSGVLGQVYSYFLQQATAVAELAQHQLAFER